MKTFVTTAGLVALLAGGCATAKTMTPSMEALTPQQKKVYADFDACQAEARAPATVLGRVNPDGTFTLDGYPNQRYPIVYCMRAKGHTID